MTTVDDGVAATAALASATFAFATATFAAIFASAVWAMEPAPLAAASTCAATDTALTKQCGSDVRVRGARGGREWPLNEAQRALTGTSYV